jgi:hypothetical protein
MEVRNLLQCIMSLHTKSYIRSEGVQIGKVASAMGIIGIWTGANRAQGEFCNQARLPVT